MGRIIACLLFLTPAAFAQDATQIAAYEAGRFEQAIQSHGEAIETADGLAFKARVLLAKGICEGTQPPADLLEKAETHARNALTIDSGHIEAKLQLAIALSLKARPLSTRAAMQTGYGEEAKALAEAALKADPNNPYAHAFMAVWHVEVVRRGGAVGSRIMGASVKKGRKHYERASALLPTDASLHWQYARALAALNPKKYRADIDAALVKALDVPIDGHVEKVMVSRAAELKHRLKIDTRTKVSSWANEML